MKDFSNFKKYCLSISHELAAKAAQIAKDELSKHPDIDGVVLAGAIVQANTVFTFELLEKYHEWLHK